MFLLGGGVKQAERRCWKVCIALPGRKPPLCRAETYLILITGMGSLQQQVGGLQRAQEGPSQSNEEVLCCVHNLI